MSKKSFFRSDKELEDLLRNISDSAEIPFSKEDWGDMKARLDQIQNPPPAWWGRKGMVWIGAGVLGLLVSLAIWYALSINQGVNQVSIGLNATDLPSDHMAEKQNMSSNLETIETKEPVDIEAFQSEAAESNSGAHTVLSTSQVSIKEKPVLNPKNMFFGNPANPAFRDPLNIRILWQSNQIPTMDFKASTPFTTIISTGNASDSKIEQKVKKSYPYAGRSSLSVQAAPDLSGIKLNQVGKAGQAVGIGAAYFLRPRFSIASGVFYSFKPYRSENETNSGYGHQPDRILGECDILDIPINLRYYPVEGKLQRAFVSVGLSSYLMLKEYYKLEYKDSGTGYPYTREINVSGANKHFFGVVNISAGYERKLGKQLSVQVEPYFKVPINGVGEGDISLKSTGLFVGLNYYPGRAKKD